MPMFVKQSDVLQHDRRRPKLACRDRAWQGDEQPALEGWGRKADCGQQSGEQTGIFLGVVQDGSHTHRPPQSKSRPDHRQLSPNRAWPSAGGGPCATRTRQGPRRAAQGPRWGCPHVEAADRDSLRQPVRQQRLPGWRTRLSVWRTFGVGRIPFDPAGGLCLPVVALVQGCSARAVFCYGRMLRDCDNQLDRMCDWDDDAVMR